MRKEEFSEKLHDGMTPVRVDERLRQQALAAIHGKENKPIMKRKISAALVFALLCIAVCAVALAVAGRMGLLDFARTVGSYIPEDAQSYVETNVASFENEDISVEISELYYDGRTVRFVANVTPKQEKTMLVGEDAMMEDPWQNLYRPAGWVYDENETRTIRDVYTQYGCERAINVSVWAEKENRDAYYSGTMDDTLNADGTLSIFRQIEFVEDRPQRELNVVVYTQAYTDPMHSEDMAEGAAVTYTIPLTAAQLATSAPTAEGVIPNTYVNTEPAVYESAGVRLDRLLIEVKPQEIYATIDYTVIDEEIYAETDSGLWFEFIDPAITGVAPHEQRLPGGLSGGGTAGALDDSETVFRQRETLGREELHETYTVRAYDAWEKNRYETHEIHMRPATAEDMEK